MGHLNRSLGLFSKLSKLARTHIYLLGGLKPHRVLSLDKGNWTACLDDLDCEERLMVDGPQVVVFDTLNFHPESFQRIAARFKTASISPEFSCLGEVGALFHRTKYESIEWSRFPRPPVMYKGLEYWISGSKLDLVSALRYNLTINEPKLNIGISMGGTDAANDTLKILDALAGLPEQSVLWVALGEGYAHSVEEIFKSADRNFHEVVIIKSNESMWRVLQNVAVVICAGGVTAYESWQAGIPSLVISRRSDWAYLVQELEDSGVAKIIPAPSGVDSEVGRSIVQFFDKRSTLHSMRRSSTEKALTDGAQRVAETLYSQLTQQKVLDARWCLD